MSQERTVTDSWEDIDETELEKRLELERLKKEQMMAAARQNGVSILTNGSDDFKPRILQRPKVTILKRPDSSPSLSSTSQQTTSKAQVKTLEQREKEYAEARLRILGSSSSADDSSLEQNKHINSKTSISSNYLPNQSHDQQQLRSSDSVIRSPKGPIPGHSGFNIRR